MRNVGQVAELSSQDEVALPQLQALSVVPSAEPRRWYALYTCTHHEKKVATELTRRGVENFLPTYAAWRNWSDRRVKLDLPLFPSYNFVRISPNERLRALTVPGVVRLVSSSAGPVSVPDIEIEGIRHYLASDRHVAPYFGAQRGALVRVSKGPLAGCTGAVLRRKGGLRLVLTIEVIARSIVLEVSAEDVELFPLTEQRRMDKGTPRLAQVTKSLTPTSSLTTLPKKKSGSVLTVASPTHRVS